MSQQKFIGKKAIILVDNGFCERELVQAQDALTALGINCRLVSVGKDNIRGWNERSSVNKSNWGQEYAVDQKIEDVQAAEYSALIIPGGKRSIDKLKNAFETKPLITSFLHTSKPVIAYNSAVNLLEFFELLKGYSVAVKNDICATMSAIGTHAVSPDMIASKNLLTISGFKKQTQLEMAQAVSCILLGEEYAGKRVGLSDLPYAHKVA